MCRCIFRGLREQFRSLGCYWQDVWGERWVSSLFSINVAYFVRSLLVLSLLSNSCSSTRATRLSVSCGVIFFFFLFLFWSFCRPLVMIALNQPKLKQSKEGMNPCSYITCRVTIGLSMLYCQFERLVFSGVPDLSFVWKYDNFIYMMVLCTNASCLCLAWY